MTYLTDWNCICRCGPMMGTAHGICTTGNIVLLGVALGVVLLVLLVAREVAWVIRQGNKEKMGMEEDEE